MPSTASTASTADGTNAKDKAQGPAPAPPTMASSSSTSHRRTASSTNSAPHSHASHPLSTLRTNHQLLPGATPSYELLQDPLAGLTAFPPTTVPLIGISNPSPTLSPATSPRIGIVPSQPLGANAAAKPSSHKQLSSPHDTSPSTSIFRSRTPPSRSNSVQASRDRPRRQDSLPRSAANAAQSFIDRVGARASPTFRRVPLRSHSKDRQSDPSDDDDPAAQGPSSVGSSSGDEADKGHGRDHHHNLLQRRSIGSFSQRRNTPAPIKTATDAPQRRGSTKSAIDSPISPAYPRSASVAEGRKTPAKYRPDSRLAAEKLRHAGAWAPDSPWDAPIPHHRHQTPVAESPFSTKVPARTGSLRHSAIPMAVEDPSPPSTSNDTARSPVFVPQARRGRLNLKPPGRTAGSSRRRKNGTRRSPSSAPKRSFSENIVHWASTIAWHAIHPIHTIRVADASIKTSMREMDAAFRDPATGDRCWWPEWIGAYIPLLIWLVVSISSTVIVLIFHTQVFRGLDQLSQTLQALGTGGRMVLGSLIFLTTFPPLPLYSTLIVLCGFSFGLWQGFLVSYIAALSGAVVVFLLSKTFLRSWMSGLLAKSGGLKKVVRAIEKRPKLLFLIRLAPYPYNLMNTLLASSPTLTFKTYFTCTALALPKLLVHCGLGTSIKNFAAYHGADKSAEGSGDHPHSSQPSTAETVKKVAGIVGVVLCIGIFFYLFAVARRAVDEELDGEDGYENVDDEDRAASKEMTRRVRSTPNGDYSAVDFDLDSDDDDDDAEEEQGEEDGLVHSDSTSLSDIVPLDHRDGLALDHQHWMPGSTANGGWLHDQGPYTSRSHSPKTLLPDPSAPTADDHADAIYRIASPEHDESFDATFHSSASANQQLDASTRTHNHRGMEDNSPSLIDQIALMEAEAERHCASPKPS